ncbi:hypothetical protein HAX54_041806 [Datura stramonium]|uniref:Uncharacterized protein n=1 Tax=Datura stramonium TaxID=4076 RepID=A0ABS8W0T3_DATST|nr:hypothetical protein [Datura stramonium]
MHKIHSHLKWKTSWLLVVVLGVVLASLGGAEGRKSRILEESSSSSSYDLEYSAISCRAHSASITDFGGVGDGKTLNTKAFQEAVNQLSNYASDGGSQLVLLVSGSLVASILPSHFTLFLQKDAVLLASQGINDWAVIDPLPSSMVMGGMHQVEGTSVFYLALTSLMLSSQVRMGQ